MNYKQNRKLIIKGFSSRLKLTAEEHNLAEEMTGKIQYIESCKIYINTKYAVGEIVKFIEEILDIYNYEYAEVKLMFME